VVAIAAMLAHIFGFSPFVTYGLAALVLAYAAWSSRDNVAALRTARILAVLSIAAAAWSEDSTRWAFLGSGVLLMLFFAVSQAVRQALRLAHLETAHLDVRRPL